MEYDIASKNLQEVGFKVDYIISNFCSTQCQNLIVPKRRYASNALIEYFDIVRNRCEFEKWYFGHYHMKKNHSVLLNYKDELCVIY